MTSAELLEDGFTRVRDTVRRAVDGLTLDDLTYRVTPDANSIGWLVWHLTRIQDDHLADAFDAEQIWTAQAWESRFGLPFGRSATGYAQSSADVAAVRVSAELLTGYHNAVYEQTVMQLRTVSDADLPRVVDSSFDPPVTLAVRLMSVISDDLQHVGQAAYVRGLLPR
jgi:hypothetical protein